LTTICRVLLHFGVVWSAVLSIRASSKRNIKLLQSIKAKAQRIRDDIHVDEDTEGKGTYNLYKMDLKDLTCTCASWANGHVCAHLRALALRCGGLDKYVLIEDPYN